MTEKFRANFTDPVARADALRKLGQKRGNLEITVKECLALRSLRANAFLWAAVIPAMQDLLRSTGQTFTPEECCDYLKMLFLSKTAIDPKTGEATVIPGHSSTKDTAEFSQFIEDARQWIEDRGGYVPEPEMAKAS